MREPQPFPWRPGLSDAEWLRRNRIQSAPEICEEPQPEPEEEPVLATQADLLEIIISQSAQLEDVRKAQAEMRISRDAWRSFGLACFLVVVIVAVGQVWG